MGMKQYFAAVAGGALAISILAAVPQFNAEKNKNTSFIIGWPTSASSARPQGYPHVISTWVDTLASIRGTAADTSGYFDLYSFDTIVFTGTDTSASDSVAYKAYLYVGRSNQFRNTPLKMVWSDWVLADSLSVTASGQKIWNITANAIPVGDFGLVKVVGQAANKKVSPTLVKAAFSGTN